MSSPYGPSNPLEVGDLCYHCTDHHSWSLMRVASTGQSPKGLTCSLVLVPFPKETFANAASAKVTVAQSLVKMAQADEGDLEGSVEDLFRLQVLEPWTIMHEVRKRYWTGKYFTSIGPIMVCVNPYNSNIPLYTPALQESYIRGETGDPHLWCVAERVYHALKKHGNQCVLVSGESGSGKTFSIRMITEYLAKCSTYHAPPSEQGDAARVAYLQPKVGLILEAFGNAKTRRNKDSSRFAKFAKLQFNAKGYLVGCATQCYLLEVSRVASHVKGERSFHIFYQMYSTYKSEYGLERCRDWLFQGFTEQEWLKDPNGEAFAREQHHQVQESFRALGFTAEEVLEVYDVLSGIMHLMCIRFEENKEGTVKLNQRVQDWLQYVSQLWGLDYADLKEKMTNHHRVVAGESMLSPLTAAEANKKREALCKKVYQRVFEYINRRLNEICDGGYGSWIGMLDIFGFENFDVNSFEQFSINFANEKLQYYYSQTTKDLLDLYKREGLQAPEGLSEDVADNTPSVMAMEKIIAILDDMCSNPKANPTETDLLHAIYHERGEIKDKKTGADVIGRPGPRDEQDSFSVKHYADPMPVWYMGEEFLAKNRSKVSKDIMDTIANSTLLVLRDTDEEMQQKQAAKGPRKAAEKPLAGTFKKDMTRLLATMSEEAGLSNLHWIRCIKPNAKEEPQSFEGTITMKQLECVLPLLEVAKVSQDVWMDHGSFCLRFGIVIPKKQLGSLWDGDDLSSKIDEIFNFVERSSNGTLKSGKEMQKGHTQVCMSRAVYALLEGYRTRRVGLGLLFVAARVIGKARRLVRVRRGVQELEDTLERQENLRHEIQANEVNERRNIERERDQGRDDVWKREQDRLAKQKAEEARKREEERARLEAEEAEKARKREEERREAERIEAERKRLEAEQLEAERKRLEEEQAKQAREREIARVRSTTRAEMMEVVREKELENEREVAKIRAEVEQSQSSIQDLQMELQMERNQCREESKRIEREKDRDLKEREQVWMQEKEEIENELRAEKRKAQEGREQALQELKKAQEYNEVVRKEERAKAEALRRNAEAEVGKWEEEMDALRDEVRSLQHKLRKTENRLQDVTEQKESERERLLAEMQRMKERTDRESRIEKENAWRQMEEEKKRDIEAMRQEMHQERIKFRKVWEDEREKAREQMEKKLHEMSQELAKAATDPEGMEEVEQKWREEKDRALREAKAHWQQERDRMTSEWEEELKEEKEIVKAATEAKVRDELRAEVDEAVDLVRKEYEARHAEELERYRTGLREEREMGRKLAEESMGAMMDFEKGKWEQEREQLQWQIEKDKQTTKWQVEREKDSELRDIAKERDELKLQVESLQSHLKDVQSLGGESKKEDDLERKHKKEEVNELLKELEKQRLELEKEKKQEVLRAELYGERVKERCQEEARQEMEREMARWSEEKKVIQMEIQSKASKEARQEMEREMASWAEEKKVIQMEIQSKASKEVERIKRDYDTQIDMWKDRIEKECTEMETRFRQEREQENTRKEKWMVNERVRIRNEVLDHLKRDHEKGIECGVCGAEKGPKQEVVGSPDGEKANLHQQIKELLMQLAHAKEHAETKAHKERDTQQDLETMTRRHQHELEHLRQTLTQEKDAALRKMAREWESEKRELRFESEKSRQLMQSKLEAQRLEELARQRAQLDEERDALWREKREALACAHESYQQAQLKLRGQLAPFKRAMQAMSEVLATGPGSPAGVRPNGAPPGPGPSPKGVGSSPKIIGSSPKIGGSSNSIPP